MQGIRKERRQREKKEGGQIIERLESQFFIASSDLPSQEYFLALQRRSPLAHDPAGSPCIRDTAGVVEPRLRRWGGEGEDKKTSSQHQISCGVNADTCLPPFSSASAEICFSRYVPAFFFPPISYLVSTAVYSYGFISLFLLFITSFFNFKFAFLFYFETRRHQTVGLEKNISPPPSRHNIRPPFRGAPYKTMNYFQV